MFRIFKRRSFCDTHLRLSEDNRGEKALREIERINRDRDMMDENYEKDFAIKEAWVKIGMNRRMGVRGIDCSAKEQINIFNPLRDSSRLALFHTCECSVDGQNGQADELGDTKISADQLKELVKNPQRPPGPDTTRRSGRLCQQCKNNFRFTQAVVGNCTWFVKFNPTPESADPGLWPEQIHFKNIESPEGEFFDSVTFQKEYFSFVGPLAESQNEVDEVGPLPADGSKKASLTESSIHQVSFHFFDGKIFYYDDLIRNGKLRKVRSPMHYIRAKKLVPEAIVYVKTDIQIHPIFADSSPSSDSSTDAAGLWSFQKMPKKN